jgi:hypothetical protein
MALATQIVIVAIIIGLLFILWVLGRTGNQRLAAGLAIAGVILVAVIAVVASR